MASPSKSLEGKHPEKKSKKKSAKKHKIKRMTIEPAHNGGFVVRHEFEPEEQEGQAPDGGPMPAQAPPDEMHAMGSGDDLLNHVGDNFIGGGGAQQ